MRVCWVRPLTWIGSRSSKRIAVCAWVAFENMVERVFADDDLPARRVFLQALGEVDGVADSGERAAVDAADVAERGDARMNADAVEVRLRIDAERADRGG